MSVGRKKIFYALATLVCIVLGLASRKMGFLPEFLTDHAGDSIWAAMVYFGLAFVLGKRHKILATATMAYLFSVAIECSQLIDSRVFDLVRDNTIGRLVFGFEFGYIDLLRYAVGILLAGSMDYFLFDGNSETE